MKTVLFVFLLFLSAFCSADNSFLSGDHPERNRRKRSYTSWYFDAGYTNFGMLGKNYHGSTFNFGIQGVGKKFLGGFHCGTDFVLNPNYEPGDSLPSPHALHTLLYINISGMFGVRLGERARLELPVKINMPFGGEYVPSFYIPAYVNDYRIELVTVGVNFIFRLNNYQSQQNAYIGIGSNYRFAFLPSTAGVIGKNRNYSGISHFLFLRFDLNT